MPTQYEMNPPQLLFLKLVALNNNRVLKSWEFAL